MRLKIIHHRRPVGDKWNSWTEVVNAATGERLEWVAEVVTRYGPTGVTTTLSLLDVEVQTVDEPPEPKYEGPDL